MHRKVRVLGIAPYEGMKTIMQKLAAERSDVEVDVFVGDLEKGAAIAKSNLPGNYDAVISRGGTAELIEQITSLPVIEITLSVYDILRAIKLAENYADRYAIVGFSGITGSAHLLCDLLQYKIDIFTIHSENEVQGTLKDLKKNGYRMVLCDMIANTIAKRLGLNAILITSGSESISMAFDQAVKVSRNYAVLREKNRFLEAVIRGGSGDTIVLHKDGSVFFSSRESEPLPELLECLQRELPAVLKENTHKFFKNIDGTLYSFTSRRMEYQGTSYAVYYFSGSPVPFATSKYGIQYSNLQEAEDQFFNSFYSVTSAASNMQTTIENINQTDVPVMLSGEPGSGKEQVARVIYSQSIRKNNPLITINCSLINDRSWNFITNHYNSPFNDNNNTIYIKDITVLPDNRRQQLLSIIVDMNLCKRNRMIFSCICPPGQGIPKEAVDFVNLLSCVTIHLPPLREWRQEIPTLSSLYLNTINVSMANQIIGFEPEAMKLMEQYDWPSNYTQFKRILNELSLVTSTPYIQTKHVEALLEKEKEQFALDGPSPNTESSLDLNRSLDEINQEIIRQVLAQTGGNQSAAAKRLSISRTTLWRYLKNEKE